MPESKPSNWLSQFRRIITSQNGEDGVIEKVFAIIGTKNKWCVEFGASSGQRGSNTWNLIRNHGWSAVLIEGDRAMYKKLARCYVDLSRVHCQRAYVSPKGKNSLMVLLAQSPIPTDFDFLSIDIDSNDYQIWESLRNYRPRVVMIEFNHGIPMDVDFVQPRDFRLGTGSSLLALCKLAARKGYELVYAYATNALFVRRELFSQFEITDNAPDKILGKMQPTRRFFELPDGSIVLLDSDRQRLLSRRKKIYWRPVWILADGVLCPVNFCRNWGLVRIVKNIVKGSFIYPAIYPLVMGIYGYIDNRRRKDIN